MVKTDPNILRRVLSRRTPAVLAAPHASGVVGSGRPGALRRATRHKDLRMGFLSKRPPQGVSPEQWARFTPFQRAVYRAVCEIPPGETRSYQWVARRIGRPRAARAVGQALRANPCAPAIPCHRVIRANGTLGGYAGGLRKKRALLQREARA